MLAVNVRYVIVCYEPVWAHAMLNDLQAVETYGGIDILVSNAGINPSYTTFLEVRSQFMCTNYSLLYP